MLTRWAREDIDTSNSGRSPDTGATNTSDRKLTIVTAHSYYQWWGGEDEVFETGNQLLESHGHRVVSYSTHNDEISNMHLFSVAAGTIWRRSVARELRALFRKVRPDVVYFSNTFPLISPAAYYAAAAEGVPVLQRLPNYRLLCASGTLFRNGSICEACLGRTVPLPAVRHACYRGSVAGTAVVGMMQTAHKVIGTWKHKVDRYVATSAFTKAKYVEGGFPAERIAVQPNAVPDPGWRQDAERSGALFVGRLSDEKGLDTLLKAWRQTTIQLDIMGDGPIMARLKPNAPANARFHGSKSRRQIVDALRKAQFVVVPSEWYEPFGLVTIEAFAVGTPVIASRLAGLEEIVEDGVTGLHFTPGDADDIVAKVAWATEHPERMREMGENARRTYLEKYTPEVTYRSLMAIYGEAIEENARRRRK